MSLLSGSTLSDLIATYGVWAVFVLVALESSGLPLPGETALITAAIHAGATHRPGIAVVILAASAGAIIGDNIGYWVGRGLGFRLLVRYGPRIGLDERRLKLGQYLFMRHGRAIVFIGRFIAVLRAWAAVLAGANRMAWRRFLLFNALGGIAWATLYGLGGYWLGHEVHRIAGPVDLGLIALAAAVALGGWRYLRRYETVLEAEAERALPGPLVDARTGRPARP